ncbi:hypothetical protein VTO42DRAFT_5481 [Malbranchea cinnamomea]
MAAKAWQVAGGIQALSNTVKEQATQAFQDYWAPNIPKRYADLEIPLQKASIEKKFL